MMIFKQVLGLLLLLVPTVVSAHNFAICKTFTDHFHVSSVSINPDKPQGGKALTVSVSFTPDMDVKAPVSAKISVKVFGVRVYATNIDDLCTYLVGTDYSCPFAKGKAQTLTLSLDQVPAEVPSNIQANVEVAFFEGATPLSCIDISVQTAKVLDAKEFGKVFNLIHDNRNKARKLELEDSGVRFLFSKWLQQYHPIATGALTWFKKDDETSKLMYEERLNIFAMNLVDIAEHNQLYDQGKVTYAKSMNQFGHLTPHEFRTMYLTGYKSNAKRRRVVSRSETDDKKDGGLFSSFFSNIGNKALRMIPSSPSADIAGQKSASAVHDDGLPNEIDWVEKGAVTKVKNQGSCGSCWAFSAIAALESAYFIKHGELKEFSEQELVSCEEDCYGCRGGLMDNAFNWIKRHGGVCTEESYPYISGATGQNGFCRVGGLKPKCTPDPKTKITSFVNVEHTEAAVKAVIAERPISIAIEADQFAFQFYSHGILTGECGDKDDHGVFLVGYGNLDGTDFWKIKNSWGATWGMDGYVLIQRGKPLPHENGQCGMLVDPVYPVL